MYDVLGDKATFAKTLPIQKWETELGKSFQDEDWAQAIRFLVSNFKCVTHYEAGLKTFLHWYFTPQRLNTIYPASSPNCWRECGARGSLLHILWACPVITPYWHSVFDLISGILAQVMDPCPELALLFLGIHNIPPDCRNIVGHVLLSAKLIITRYWKQSVSPTIAEVIQEVNKSCRYESLMPPTIIPLKSRLLTWDPWLHNSNYSP